MGHERIGFLPRTKQWQAIIEQLSGYDNSPACVAQIAEATLWNIKSIYKSMPYDESVIKSIKYLTILSTSAKTDNQIEFLRENGLNIGKDLSLFALVRCAKSYITTDNGSLESNKIAQDSVLQALASYEKEHTTAQLSLLSTESPNIWDSIGTGAAFCELSRSFFASFSDRYLRYFLEREAAHSIDNYKAIESFSTQLSAQAQALSHHAFDTAKLTQSFAAGWYTNHAKDHLPSEKEVVGFLGMAFTKLREEFRREADGQ
jgi:hypothetical protein